MMVMFLQCPIPFLFRKSYGKSSRVLVFFKNKNFMFIFSQTKSCGKTGKACSNYGNFHTEALRLPKRINSPSPVMPIPIIPNSVNETPGGSTGGGIGEVVTTGVTTGRGVGVGVNTGTPGDGVGVAVVAGRVGIGVADGVADSATCVPDSKTVKVLIIVRKIPEASRADIVMVCLPGGRGEAGL